MIATRIARLEMIPIRVAASAAHQLVRSLKQHKRQNRIVESTLASLKQLQKTAG